MKTLHSMIFDAREKFDLWSRIARDAEALSDRNMSKKQALIVSAYFEGRLNGLVDAQRIENSK